MKVGKMHIGIIERLRWEGTSRDGLTQLCSPERVRYIRLLKTMSSQVLTISKDRESTTSGKPVPVFHHYYKKKEIKCF